MRAFLLVALIATSLPLIVSAEPNEAALMAQAQRAYLGGDFDTAKQLFTQVTEMDPHNTLAVQFLRNIRQRQAGLPVAKKQDPLNELIIPKIEFKDATFTASLDFLKQKAADQSVNVSFVSKLPAPQMDHTVTLSLSQIPFLEALKYLCALNDATYKVERFAIVITPAGAGPVPAPSAQ